MSQHTLISFLGRTPRGENGYRRTRYRFDDGTEADVAFFGWALCERQPPDRMVILGTEGSMWDHLFEGDFCLGNVAEDARLQLGEAVEAGQVTQRQLDELAPLLAERLGCEVVLRIIPYCRTPREQVRLLTIMAEQVPEAARLSLDVTHGYRHLPMLALLSALHLRQVRQARIEAIWYGAFDPDTGEAPVHDLAGLLHIADGIEALAAYERSGDYGVFGGFFAPPLEEALAEASFFENLNQLGSARGKARQARDRLAADETADDDPVAELLQPELLRRLEWVEEERFHLRQAELARRHLRQGNYLAAVLLAYEAFISRLVQEAGGQPANAQDRQRARDAFDERERQHQPRREIYRAWDTLRRLRNTLVHGNQAKGPEVQRALGSRAAMQALLDDLFARLLG